MARQARIVLPGVAHHVTQRGNDRQDVFFSDRDRAVYLQYLRESSLREGLGLLAYCLMSNHVHLVVVPQRADSLWRALARTHQMYAQHVFRRDARSGHLWQSRFYSCPLDEAHEHNAAAYVELNPVRAGMMEAPWEYAWSSAAAHCGLGGDVSGMLDLGRWFSQYTTDSWRGTLAAIAESPETLERIRRHTLSGKPLGSESFVEGIEKLLEKTLEVRGVGRPKGRKDSRPRFRRKKGGVNQ